MIGHEKVKMRPLCHLLHNFASWISFKIPYLVCSVDFVVVYQIAGAFLEPGDGGFEAEAPENLRTHVRRSHLACHSRALNNS